MVHSGSWDLNPHFQLSVKTCQYGILGDFVIVICVALTSLLLLLMLLLKLLLSSLPSLSWTPSFLGLPLCSGHPKQRSNWTCKIRSPRRSSSSRCVAPCEPRHSHRVSSIACCHACHVGGTTRGWQVILHHDLHCLCY